jgi:3-phenylpropionate/cinnamic acid dioxygenase small subunit
MVRSDTAAARYDVAAMTDDRLEVACARFLSREADALDRRQFDAWLALLHPEIDYRVPVRTTRLARDGDGFSAVAFFMKENLGTLNLRIKRLKSDYAWAENPPTRTRRLITNTRLDRATDEECAVKSNFAVYCFRGDNPVPVVLTGERQDVLAAVGGDWRLKKRLVLLDTTVLGMESLSIFL